MADDKRDGAVLEQGVARVDLSRDPEGISRREGEAPGYTIIELSAERVRQLAGEPIKAPRSTGGVRRYSLSGPIRHNLLRQRREECGFSVSEIAAAAALPEPIVLSIEADTEPATDRDMRMLSAALGHDGDLDYAFPWELQTSSPAPRVERTSSATPVPPRTTPADLAEDVVAGEERARDELKRETRSLRERIRRMGR